jgi:hypothetical protein
MGKSYSGVASRAFDNSPTWLEQALVFCIFNDIQSRPIFNRPTGILKFCFA